MLASRDERLAENHRTSRRANERLHELAEARSGGTTVPFLCECAGDTCLGRIEVTASDYYAIHVDRTHFIVLDGHPTVPGDEVLEQVDGFQILRSP